MTDTSTTSAVTLQLIDASPTTTTAPTDVLLPVHVGHVLLLLLNVVVVVGNCIVIFVILFDRKLRVVTTNKFIASLAVSDLLVGLIVMPLSLYYKTQGDEWSRSSSLCQLHLVSGVFSSTASIVHLVAISLDRYFAIMFPTEYQRHSVSTATCPYIVMIWVMALAVSCTLFLENVTAFGPQCWVTNPQYILLSSLLSFFLPGFIVVYMYVKIFRKLRHHQLYMFGQTTTGNKIEKKRSLPRVIIEEVRSRRGSRLSQTGSNSGSPTRRSSGSHKSERSPSQPEIHVVSLPLQRWRSPTICAETFEHDRIAAAKKRVSIVPDPPSMDISSVSNMASIRAEHESAKEREKEMLNSRRQQNNADDIPGNEVLRKLSEDRKVRRQERRKLSAEGPPPINGIMEAFDKPSLSTVCDEEISSSQEASTDEVVVEVTVEPPPKNSPMTTSQSNGPMKTERLNSLELSDKERSISSMSHMDAVETETSEEAGVDQPLLLHANNNEENARPSSPLLSVPLCGSRRPSKTTSNNNSKPRLSCASLIPPPTFLMVPAIMSINTPPTSPLIKDAAASNSTLKVPRLYECPSPTSCDFPPSNSSHSSYTSASGSSETYRRISTNSFGSTLTDSSYDADSRRSSAWSTLRAAVLNEPRRGKKSLVDMDIDRTKKNSAISRGKLRRIATQVTRAIRRKRRESLAIRRESRATRVVAAILIAFILCWMPYYMVLVYRGIITGLRIIPTDSSPGNTHYQVFIATSWLGYAHSAFNPVIYMCLNKNFRHTIRRLVSWIRTMANERAERDRLAAVSVALSQA